MPETLEELMARQKEVCALACMRVCTYHVRPHAPLLVCLVVSAPLHNIKCVDVQAGRQRLVKVFARVSPDIL